MTGLENDGRASALEPRRPENRRTRREVAYDAVALASGTIASLIGDRRYSEIEKAQAAFVRFVTETPPAYPNWMLAWQAFAYAGHPGFDRAEELSAPEGIAE